jgi:hypothetical protein
MNNPRPDVFEILELEKEYHADQIKRINVAIAALKGEVNVKETFSPEQTPQKSTKPVQWTSEIKNIFRDGEIYSIEEVRNKLIEKGIVEAMEEGGKNSINSTFSRLKKGGFLEQPEYGKYRKKRRVRRRIPTEEIKDEIADEGLNQI